MPFWMVTNRRSVPSMKTGYSSYPSMGTAGSCGTAWGRERAGRRCRRCCRCRRCRRRRRCHPLGKPRCRGARWLGALRNRQRAQPDTEALVHAVSMPERCTSATRGGVLWGWPTPVPGVRRARPRPPRRAFVFPDPRLAEEDGLLAVGGDPSARRLLLVYAHGIFRYNSDEQPVLWFSPDPASCFGLPTSTSPEASRSAFAAVTT